MMTQKVRLSLFDFRLSVSRGDLAREQQVDRSLKPLFEGALDAADVLKKIWMRHNKASANHTQSQGALERFHALLKSLLRAYRTQLG